MGTDDDLVRALRGAQLTGLTHQATLASPFATIADVDQAGAEAAQGLVLVSPFYWNSDDRVAALPAGGKSANQRPRQ